ncbi:MAG: hypothetical protein A2293_02825 [Elusimicrobia bacterium RIFOXYB2_FULL_49_7]|nr:MAG: hypothetical protein A2293_02825 [Elusimicrobia bacterium RIFOXYB2_FULL_49_7]
MKAMNDNIRKAIKLSHELSALADKGDLERDDNSCGVLYGILRDAAYKIRGYAEKERRKHIQAGAWQREKEPSMAEKNIQELIDFAISEEQQAVELYTAMAGRMSDKGAAQMLLDMADMERGHEKRLRDFNAGQLSTLNSTPQTRDLKIGDYLMTVKLRSSSTVQEALIFAIKAEMKSCALYTDLARIFQEPEKQAFMKKLADEELKHKNDLEILYDDFINREN